MTSYLSRRATPPPNGAASGPADAGSWSSQLPALAEFLVATSWSDGTSRLPGTLTLFTDGPQWKLCLSDKDQGQVAFVTGSCPQEAFLAAERGLVAANLDWRVSSPSTRKKSK